MAHKKRRLDPRNAKVIANCLLHPRPVIFFTIPILQRGKNLSLRCFSDHGATHTRKVSHFPTRSHWRLSYANRMEACHGCSWIRPMASMRALITNCSPHEAPKNAWCETTREFFEEWECRRAVNLTWIPQSQRHQQPCARFKEAITHFQKMLNKLKEKEKNFSPRTYEEHHQPHEVLAAILASRDQRYFLFQISMNDLNIWQKVAKACWPPICAPKGPQYYQSE